MIKNNTIANRDILHQEKNYLKNEKNIYQELYGKNGVDFCNEVVKEVKKEKKDNNIINNNNKDNVKKNKVRFSAIVEYTRN